MRLSEKPTAYLLLQAFTGSEWDECQFAIVRITEEWKKQQAKRLEAVQPFAKDINFLSLNYHDTAVNFYKTNGEEQPNLEQLLPKEGWAFVELDEGEQESFAAPEQRLDCYTLVVLKGGNAYYKAFGKNTDEEFWTEQFPLKQLIQ
jgi:hypothetical protein